jgi:hypothetical protein
MSVSKLDPSSPPQVVMSGTHSYNPHESKQSLPAPPGNAGEPSSLLLW